MKFQLICALLLVQLVSFLNAELITYKNQLTLISTEYFPTSSTNLDLYGLWQPQADLHKDLNDNFSIDTEAILSASLRKEFNPGKDKFSDNEKVYRLWIKGGSKQAELRVGLQRLNFGSATLLRPLQWFDNLDPRDRLEQTDGVQAALGRYFFLNNANLWVWGIRGEGKQRGLLPTVTKKGTPEFGGRIQYPLKTGDIGFTFNHRQETLFHTLEVGNENSVGLDIRLDYKFGLWGEASLSKSEKNIALHSIIPLINPKWQGAFTQGGDYTFGVGNGIYVLIENQLHVNSDKDLKDFHPDYWTIAMTTSYPLGILDNILYYAVIRYDGTTAVQTILWRRTYDKLSWDASIFWDSGSKYQFYSSRGVKLLLSYIF
jgi:hypothetical protein